MRYIYNTVGRLVNGVIIYFEPGDGKPGDEKFATLALHVIAKSQQSPTSIVWGSRSLTKKGALSLIRPLSSEILKQGVLGIRFTIEKEAELLREFLDELENEDPTLSELVQELRNNILPNKKLLN